MQSEHVSDPAEPGLLSAKRGGSILFQKGGPNIVVKVAEWRYVTLARVCVVWFGAAGKGQAMRKTNFLPGVLALLAAVPWCPGAAPEPPPAAAQHTYIYANSQLWCARLVRKDVAPPGIACQRTVTLPISHHLPIPSPLPNPAFMEIL